MALLAQCRESGVFGTGLMSGNIELIHVVHHMRSSGMS